MGGDAEIMIVLDPAARVTIFDYAGLKSYIGDLFDGTSLSVNRDGLEPTSETRVVVSDAIPMRSRQASAALLDILPVCGAWFGTATSRARTSILFGMTRERSML